MFTGSCVDKIYPPYLKDKKWKYGKVSTIAQISVAVSEMGFSGIKAIKKALSTKSVPKTIFNMSKILLCYVVNNSFYFKLVAKDYFPNKS